MARKIKESQVCVRITKDLERRLNKYADQINESKAELIRDLIVEELDNVGIK